MSRKVFFKLIVPNYNKIAYIKKCLDSIVQQTFQNFICVVVDDMSTDMSDTLVEYYERRYPGKIKLIKCTEKKYAGGARNIGIKYDKYESEYTMFVDADDFLASNDALQLVYDNLEKQSFPDMLLYKFNYINNLTKKIDDFNRNSANLLLSDYRAAIFHTIKSEKQPLFLENTNFAEDIYAWMVALNTISDIKQCNDVIYTVNVKSQNSTTKANYARSEEYKKVFTDALLEYYPKIKDEYLKQSVVNRLLFDGIDIYSLYSSFVPFKTEKKKLKICIISAGTENLEFQYVLTNVNKQRYCDLHGYEYKFIPLENDYKKSYHSRKQLIIDEIDSKKYDWVMWMDCDAWFNNFEISLESIIQTYANKDTSLIIARDHGVLNRPDKWFDCYINSGILLFKANDDAKKIIDIWSNPTEDAKAWMSSITKLNDQPYLSILMLWDSFVKCHTAVVQPYVLNTFARLGICKDTFICHVPGDKKKNARNWYKAHFETWFYKSEEILTQQMLHDIQQRNIQS